MSDAERFDWWDILGGPLVVPDDLVMPSRTGRPRRAMALAREILEEPAGRGATVCAAAAYIASLAVGPSVAEVSVETGLPYDFVCALAQNWLRAGFWQPNGKVVIEFDPEAAEAGIEKIAILLAAKLGMGELTWEKLSSTEAQQ